MKIVIDLGKMKDSLVSMYNGFLGHDTKGYFRVPDTPQDLPNPENDTPWAGTIKYSIEKFNKITKKDGHGIGMMIVHRIVRDHGGDVGIDSKQDAGTVVTVRFPRKSPQHGLLESTNPEPSI